MDPASDGAGRAWLVLAAKNERRALTDEHASTNRDLAAAEVGANRSRPHDERRVDARREVAVTRRASRGADDAGREGEECADRERGCGRKSKGSPHPHASTSGSRWPR